MRLRWERILTLIGVLIAPILINWLYHCLYVGPFHRVRGIGKLEYYPEAKALALLGILLVGIVLAFKVLRNGSDKSHT